MSDEDWIQLEILKKKNEEVARARSQRNRLMSVIKEFGYEIVGDPEGMSGALRARWSKVVGVHDEVCEQMDLDSFPKYVYTDGEEYEAVIDALETLEFYADPHTYFAIGIFPDPPNGDFMDDFSETGELGAKPGKRAREASDKLTKVFEGKRTWPKSKNSGSNGTASAEPSCGGS